MTLTAIAFKKDDVVSIPKGTKLVRANPILLDPKPIHGEMRYNALGKIDQIRDKGIVSVAVWDAGRSSPWYCNVEASALELANVKLGYDRRRNMLTWTFEDGSVHPPRIPVKKRVKKYPIEMDYAEVNGRKIKRVRVSRPNEEEDVFCIHIGKRFVLSLSLDDLKNIVDECEMV